MLYIAVLVLMLLVACAPLRTGAQAGSAEQALEAALRDYERGSLATLEAMLPASFASRSTLLDAARRTLAEQRQIRVTLSEIKTQNAPDARSPQALTLRWDKRFVRVATGAAALESGSLGVILRRSGSDWVFEALPADNPFTR